MIFLLKKWSRKTHLSIFRSIFCQVCLYRSWSRNTRSGGTLGNFPGTSPTSRCRHPTYSSGSLLCRRSRSDSGWEKKVPNPACLAIVQIKSNSQKKFHTKTTKVSDCLFLEIIRYKQAIICTLMSSKRLG